MFLIPVDLKKGIKQRDAFEDKERRNELAGPLEAAFKSMKVK